MLREGCGLRGLYARYCCVARRIPQLLQGECKKHRSDPFTGQVCHTQFDLEVQRTTPPLTLVNPRTFATDRILFPFQLPLTATNLSATTCKKIQDTKYYLPRSKTKPTKNTGFFK